MCMLTSDEMQTFEDLFNKYCRQEVLKGHCEPDCCDICPVNGAHYEIFYKFNDRKKDVEE